MAPSASTWRSWPRDGCPSRGQWKTACTRTSRIFHKVITAPPVWGNALQDNNVRRDPFLCLSSCTQFVLLARTILVCLRRAKDKQNVPHINYHSGQTLQLLTWDVILNLPLQKILFVANQSKYSLLAKSMETYFQKWARHPICPLDESKSFTWKICIDSNSIAIQTSPSLKCWQDECYLVQTNRESQRTTRKRVRRFVHNKSH